MNFLESNNFDKENLTKNELIIYQCIKQDPQLIIKCSIEHLAKETHTSKAAIIRFSKKLGYSGFAELKFELSRYIISGERKENTGEDFDTIQSITSLYSGFIKQINNFVQLKDIQTIAKEMSTAKRIKIIGQNRTSFSALQLRYRMSKIGFDAEAVTDLVLLNQIKDFFQSDDFIIIFTTRAITKDYYDLCKDAIKNNVKVAVISCAQTALMKYTQYPIILPSIENASNSSFLDNQTIMFVFIEILLAELAYIKNKKTHGL